MILLKIFAAAQGLIQVSLTLILFARYIYLEKGFPSSKSRHFFWGITVFISLLYGILENVLDISEDFVILVVMILFFSYISLARDTKRIRGFFLLFPILGFIFSIFLFFVLVPLLTGHYDLETEFTWYPLTDLFIWFLLLLFYFAGKKWRKQQSEINSKRSLSLWEKGLLNCSGLFLLVLVVMLFSFRDIFTNQEEGLTFLLIGSISVLLLDLSILFLVLQGNQKRYYEQKAIENEYYLQAELRYFQARQKDQEAVRRIRHDMKNHLFCIQELLTRGEEKELASYLEELNTRLSKSSGEISLGNEIADAICWEKARLASEKNIQVTADGRFPSDAEIQLADICIIFANALDNALEFLEDSGLSHPWIHIGIQNQGNLLCLIFENPVTDSVSLPVEGKTSKNHLQHQGLGLSNIREAAERYQGTLQTEILTQNKEKIFCLEILLHTKTFHSQQDFRDSQQK